MILRERDLWFQPELRLTIGVLNVDVWPRLFSGEEVEAVPTRAENRGAHEPSITRVVSGAVSLREVGIRNALVGFRGLGSGGVLLEPGPWTGGNEVSAAAEPGIQRRAPRERSD
jgi:hypothetical protein